MATCFGRLKAAGTPSFFRRNLPQPLARQGKSNSRPRERKNASIRRKRRDLGEKKRDFGKLERKRREIRPLILPQNEPFNKRINDTFFSAVGEKSRGVSHENKPLLFRSPTTVPCMVSALTDFRNDLIRVERPTEDVDGLLLKVIDAAPQKERKKADRAAR